MGMVDGLHLASDPIFDSVTASPGPLRDWGDPSVLDELYTTSRLSFPTYSSSQEK